MALALGGCWPATETYFSSSAPGGRQTYMCGAPGYKLMLPSTQYEWVQMNVNPWLMPGGGMHLRIWVDDNLTLLHRHGERAAADLPTSDQRWHARVGFARANSVRQKAVEFSGPVTVTWPPGHRADIPVTPASSSFVVPDFTGDSAVITLPVLVIDGKSETFPPVSVQRRGGLTVDGVNGC